MRKKTDLRVRRTQMMLRKALIALIEERGFEAVTVGDIAERAMVNRTTFYLHYQDKYDLVTSIFKEAIDELSQSLGIPQEGPGRVDPEQPPQTWVKLFEHFAEHARMYRALLGQRGSPWFVAQMCEYIADLVHKRLEASRQPFQRYRMPSAIAIAAVSNAFIGMVTWWLEGELQYTPRQMASWFLRFALYGYYHALGFDTFLLPE
ncbi:TetR/AcrR family transcriptional regulator [Thermogemmatispora onikobensis]|uniref:TetR/AcrR family transcriptional regulator n=1 Tax=Thermogemmatispora onikobensis TaxID=732234 RepID=UPI000A55ADF6|nr:TetR/AcrR family transcriptional regulator [Thermogemmatispora onikobensis]